MGQVAGQAEGVSQSPPRRSLIYWWRREDSNLRHGAYETPALPPELRRLGNQISELQAGILPRRPERARNCAGTAAGSGRERGRSLGGGRGLRELALHRLAQVGRGS